MDLVWQIVTVLSSALTVVGTIVIVFTYRRERTLRARDLVLNVAISIVMLATFALLTRPGVRPLLASTALLLGLGIGLVRGLFTRLALRGGQVVGRHSLLFLLGWGLSYALAAALNLLGSALASAAGMLALCLSTGTQIGLNGWLLIRCLTLRPAAVPPPSLPERG
jgi:hypothetical protein